MFCGRETRRTERAHSLTEFAVGLYDGLGLRVIPAADDGWTDERTNKQNTNHQSGQQRSRQLLCT